MPNPVWGPYYFRPKPPKGDFTKFYSADIVLRTTMEDLSAWILDCYSIGNGEETR